MLSCPRCPVVKCVRHRGDDVCCSVVFGTLVCVLFFCCGDCDACTVVCVACVCAVRV